MKRSYFDAVFSARYDAGDGRFSAAPVNSCTALRAEHLLRRVWPMCDWAQLARRFGSEGVAIAQALREEAARDVEQCPALLADDGTWLGPGGVLGRWLRALFPLDRNRRAERAIRIALENRRAVAERFLADPDEARSFLARGDLLGYGIGVQQRAQELLASGTFGAGRA